MGMIWEHDMEFIWFLMYRINDGNGMGATIIILYWEWYGHLFSSHT